MSDWENFAKSAPLRTASESQLAQDPSDCRIELLQNPIKKTAEASRVPDIFEAEPSKVMGSLDKIQSIMGTMRFRSSS